MKHTLALALLLLSRAALPAADAPKLIQLDSGSPGRVFEGLGAVSAGASTRLLLDYPEPQRGQILDFLFKPKFGAGFQHLKVEIGSGENSTCGSEPSHAVTREELADPKPRGYEFWFMAEARKRNPDIILDCLPWAYPRWVGDRFSQESADWFAAFLEVARKNYGLELDWISAAQNEMGTDLNWIRKNLRPTLEARGFAKVKLQAPDDDSEYWQDGVLEADVLLAGGDVELGGRYADRDKLGYRWILTRDGRWQLNWQYTTLAAGQVVKFNPSAWHHLRLEMKGDQLAGFVDGNKLAAVTDKSRAQGMAFLASTYDHNLFDNVRVGPVSAQGAATP